LVRNIIYNYFKYSIQGNSITQHDGGDYLFTTDAINFLANTGNINTRSGRQLSDREIAHGT